jgi:DNA-binding IscR family transcriptional regulator
VPKTLDPVKLPWPRPRVETPSPEAFARRTVAHAFERNAGHIWTRESLANWYGVPLGLVDEVVADLVTAGVVRRMPGPNEGYMDAKPLRAVV